ncbi:MAG: hypothetical protein WCF33_04020 [Pseudonocardiaceae bacterium]
MWIFVHRTVYYRAVRRRYGTQEAASEGSDRHPPAGRRLLDPRSAGDDPVTGRQLMLSGSAETKDAAVLIRDQLRAQLRDKSRRRPTRATGR